MNPMQINFIDITTLDGYSIYTRSLIFVLYKAIRSLFPKKTLMAEYIISNGIFCPDSQQRCLSAAGYD